MIAKQLNTTLHQSKIAMYERGKIVTAYKNNKMARLNLCNKTNKNFWFKTLNSKNENYINKLRLKKQGNLKIKGQKLGIKVTERKG